MNDVAWVACETLGCPNGIAVHYRHVRNFEGRYVCDDCCSSGEQE